MKIRTHNEYPPIPIRQFDWSAVDDETYDGPGCPIGWGSTSSGAVEDLLDQVCRDRGNECGANGVCEWCDAEAGVKCRAVTP